MKTNSSVILLMLVNTEALDWEKIGEDNYELKQEM